jgi:hyperosmotically inducible protein
MKKMMLAGSVLAALAMVGCSKTDDTQTAGEKVDTVIAQTEQKAAEMKEATSQGMADAKEAVGTQVERAANAVGDAAITTAVNAELAKDSDLSAFKIDVDTSSGRVVLNGTAPSEQARDRATQLAASVQGVVSVDNLLNIEPRKQ